MKKPVPALIPFLVFISMVFIGILIYVYIETKKANPQMIETASLCRASFQLAMPAFVPAYAARAGLRPQPRPSSGGRASYQGKASAVPSLGHTGL